MRSTSIALAMVLAACGGKKKAEPGVVETCAAANDKQTVTVAGYLYTPMMTHGCDKTCIVELSDEWDYSAKQKIDLAVRAGTGPVSMEPIPTGNTMVDEHAFTITDSDGKRRPVRSFVRVTGTLAVNEWIDDGKYAASLKGQKMIVCTLTATEIHGAEAPKK